MATTTRPTKSGAADGDGVRGAPFASSWRRAQPGRRRTERIMSGAEDGGKRTEGHALYAASFSSHRRRVKDA